MHHFFQIQNMTQVPNPIQDHQQTDNENIHEEFDWLFFLIICVILRFCKQLEEQLGEQKTLQTSSFKRDEYMWIKKKKKTLMFIIDKINCCV